MNATFRFSRHALVVACSTLILATSPAHADAVQDISKAIRQGQHAQALEQADRYLAGKPKDPQARFLKGIALTELNRANDAITVFQKLTEDFPELPEPYNNLAVIYAQQRQYEKAKAALEMAIRTHPSYATAHENLGDIYARLASQAYDKALQLDSSNSSAQSKLGMIRELMTGSTRVAAVRPTSGKGSETKTVDAKPVETKPVETKPVEPKPVETKPVEIKPTVVVTATPTSTATAPTKAEPPAKTEPAPAAAGQDDVARAVSQWAAAWSSKDVRGYLAYYAKDFKTPKGLNRSAWEAERRSRIDKPGTILVKVEGMKISLDGNKATARFRQSYESGSLKTSTGKTLDMVQRDGKWQIQQERVGG